MSASTQQRLFNQYPLRKYTTDIWHGWTKDQKRASTIALTYVFLIEDGQVTKAPPAKQRKGGRPSIFQKDAPASAAYERWNRKYFAGDDFKQSGPRFTSKPLSEKSADQRDIERKAGASHAEFIGSVVQLGGKLLPRHALSATDESLVDLVSTVRSEKVVHLATDTSDRLSDANRRATIRDELNLNDIDHEHNEMFKLAA
jgi:hypothetical protein